MKNFEFKSAVCTTKEQSKKLLALGFKKETADMVYDYAVLGIYLEPKIVDWREFNFEERDIPAWSLHRLMKIMYNGDMFGFVSLITHYRNIDTIYDLVIANIEELIRINKFNNDYLEETK